MEAHNRYTMGANGIYRLKANPQRGAVAEVSVLKRATYAKLNAVMVWEFFKWKFKPGTLQQIDIPVMFESEIRVELKGAATK